MASQHEISEYIENLPLQKTLCKGYRPDDVYEVICNLSSMYNQLLSETLMENEELKKRLEDKEERQVEDVFKGVVQAEAVNSMNSIEETVMQLEKLLDIKEMEQKSQPEFLEEIELKIEIEKKSESAEEKVGEIILEELAGDTAVEEVKTTELKNEEVRKERSLTDKELQKLRRGDLLEILLELSKENDSLVWKLEEKNLEIKGLRTKLADRKIELQKAGTIAEASFKLNGVLEAAESAAQQYLDNLQRLHEKEEYLCNVKEQEVEARCTALIEKTQKQCEEYIQMTEQRCMDREREAEEKCRYLDEKARTDVDRRWNELSRRLEDFYSSHRGLRELLATSKML